MRNIFFSIAVLTVLLLITSSCQKEVTNRNSNLPSLQPVNNDLNAGTWRTVLLSRPDSFTLAAPVATNSPLYAADINEIKSLQTAYFIRPGKYDTVLGSRGRVALE